jgi:hypothetical protein
MHGYNNIVEAIERLEKANDLLKSSIPISQWEANGILGNIVFLDKVKRVKGKRDW